MPQYLVILLAVMACVIIVLCLYGLILFRRFYIVMKKIDYLVEDITYKSETLSPMIDSLLKLSTYVEVMEEIIKKNSDAIKKVTNDNKVAITKYRHQLEKILNEK